MDREQVVLVFQGGGALGAYQAGAYEALHEAGVRPDWVAGISIGAINGAIIAGSPEDRRIENLRSFWHKVSSGLTADFVGHGLAAKRAFHDAAALIGAAQGIPGFFSPRSAAPWMLAIDPNAAVSLYDTGPLHRLLDTLVDFDLVASGGPRLSLGAVDVETGNFAYFDSRQTRLSVEHVAASGALPPSFAPVEIDGRRYWDGGIVSNTPLQAVIDGNRLDQDLCIFQVDLFSARGQIPTDLCEVEAREKEIRFSSRTRLNTDRFRAEQAVRMAARRLAEKLGPDHADDPDLKLLSGYGSGAAVTLVHLINRRAAYETHMRDYEFSRVSVEEHWKNGFEDMARTLSHPDFQSRTRPEAGIRVFDLGHHRNPAPGASRKVPAPAASKEYSA